VETFTLIGAICLVPALMALVIGHAFLSKEKWKKSVKAVADALQLQVDPGSFTRSASAYGLRGPFSVKVNSYTVKTGDGAQVYSQVVVGTDLPRSLRFKKEGMFSGFKKVFTGADVEVGMERFDDAFLLEGRRELDVLSRMGARSRSAIWRAIGTSGAELKDGKITWTTRGHVKDGARLIATARGLLNLATALSDHPGGNAVALLEHIKNDPSARFRRTCLEAMLDKLPKAPETAEAVEFAAADADPGMRYLAASSLGPAGHEIIRALLREGNLPEDLRGEAAALLGPGYGGGLALAPEAPDAAGGLAIKHEAGEGALSEVAEPARRPRGTVKQ